MTFQDPAVPPSPLEHSEGDEIPVVLPPLTQVQWREIERRILMDAASAADAQARSSAYGGHLNRGMMRWEVLASVGLWLRDRADDI